MPDWSRAVADPAGACLPDALAALAVLHGDLQARKERRRTSWSTEHRTSGSGEPALPFEPNFAHLAERIEALSWIVTENEAYPARSIAARLFQGARLEIPEVDRVASGVRVLLADCIAALDPASGRLYLGPCGIDHETDCQAELFAPAVDTPETITCPECGTVCQVGARRRTLLRMARNVEMTPGEIVRLLRGWGLAGDLTERSLSGIVRRRRVPSTQALRAAPDGRIFTTPTYRFGDVWEAVNTRWRK